MNNSFFQAICRVGIFMICAQTMIHFRPREAYDKYLKLLVSVMVLIQLFLPLGSFLLGGGREEAADLLEQFARELEEGMDKAREDAAEADALLEKMTLEELRRRAEEKNSSEDGQSRGEAEEREQGQDIREGAAAGREWSRDMEEDVSAGREWSRDMEEGVSVGAEQGRDAGASGGSRNQDIAAGSRDDGKRLYVEEEEESRIGVDIRPVDPISVGGGGDRLE